MNNYLCTFFLSFLIDLFPSSCCFYFESYSTNAISETMILKRLSKCFEVQTTALISTKDPDDIQSSFKAFDFNSPCFNLYYLSIAKTLFIRSNSFASQSSVLEYMS